MIWLLLSKEQMLLFSHQHNRVITEYKEKKMGNYEREEISATNIPPKIPKLQLSSTVKFKKARQELSKLIGLPVATEIDKKLLFGMFDRPPQALNRQNKEIMNLSVNSTFTDAKVQSLTKHDRSKNYLTGNFR